MVAAALLVSVAAVNFARRTAAHEGTSYQVLGEVVSINLAENSIRIRHEDIPGYMPAMTMPFDVKEPSLLRRVNPGDAVAFRLQVTEEDSWISRIETTVPATPSSAAPEPAENLAEHLAPGESIPDFRLVNQDGASVTFSDFKGKAVLLTFIYTRCPLPDFCPLLSSKFADLQQRLNKEFPGRFQLVSLTIDPRFDTPEVLKAYAERYQAEQSSWTFATASQEEINRAAAALGLYIEDAGGLINHDLRTALISPKGKLVQVWKSNVWTPYEVQRSVRKALTGKLDVARK